MNESARERIVRMVREMQTNTIANGCTPGEAAKFAAKAAEWIERFNIDEAELRAKDGDGPAEIEVCQNKLRTGKRVFNPGMTAVVNALALGMCCRCVLLHASGEGGEAVYGIVGDSLDADYVCQVSTTVVPALQIMAILEGREHGYEKAGLVRWSNQYLTGAGTEIRQRLEKDRKERSATKEAEHDRTEGVRRSMAGGAANCTALVCITGETLALAKREAVGAAFKDLYPRTRTTFSRSSYDHTANERGRAAGKTVGLNIALDGPRVSNHDGRTVIGGPK